MHTSRPTFNYKLKYLLAPLVGLLLFPLTALADSKIQYYNSGDCDPTHLISVYSSTGASSSNTACHGAPSGTLAVWVDSLDAGCSARTYADASCTSLLGLALTPQTCYVGPSSQQSIGSFRIVCGATDASNPVPDASIPTTNPAVEVGEPQMTSSSNSSATTSSVWGGSTDAEALGRPTDDADDSTSTSAANATATSGGSVTVDPTQASKTLLTTATGGGGGNSTNVTTWSNTLTPSKSTSTNTITRTVTDEISGYTGDGGNSNQQGGGITPSPGTGDASPTGLGLGLAAVWVMLVSLLSANAGAVILWWS
ncbi:uncharacterized protein AB675_10315 [Cyphellophora attinorum]|uniref:Uncharacterized protein n=1 Tax=Cyphellophora attinorum TaxID=1664694 RepID=A0A0N1H0M5_9EURO|nr:uncharacterized protein AB675_10315 [Phialophora attinorum]KPI37493.1 hypothetical protein AB675_10315 [Phialophora attinorum]